MSRKRKTRKEKVAEHHKSVEKRSETAEHSYQKMKLLFLFGVIAGVLLLFCSFDISDRTIIQYFTLFKLSITLAAVLIFALKLIGKDILFQLDELRDVFYLGLGLCFCIALLIIHVNNLSFNTKYEIKTLKILEKRESRRGSRGPRVPTACVEYRGEKILLQFYKDEFDRLENADEVIIELKEGTLGYGVFKRFDLNEGDRRWRSE